ncbi:parallel beta-helix domain-containing protein [Pseudomonas sp. GCM10022186]|uniref:parallel beta-helix domain-containing protein n=1 Tax=Pseudomonas sp. GCM10022186 TaxID=3252650 RepID=UPI003609BF90
MRSVIRLTALIAAACMSATAAAQEFTVRSGQSIQDAVKKAKDGDVILVEPGKYTESIYIDKQNITLKSTKKGEAVLDGENKRNDGIIASGHGVVIDGFMVKGYKGNAIMTQGSNNFKIINNEVSGAFYAIFPQFGKNGLVQGNEVYGCEDAGIYVGMSDNIDVLDNIAHDNVLGLEFENTRNALMAGNKVYNNTAGIMLSLIPGLPVKDSRHVVIRDNEIYNNNLNNFAPASSIAASVPHGLGVLAVGYDDATIENNLIKDNHSAGIFVADNVTFGLADDPKVDPHPDNIRVMKNTFINNGEGPEGILADFIAPAGRVGFEIISTGKGKGHCSAQQEGVEGLGTKRWGVCDDSVSKANYKTAMLEQPVKSEPYTAEQRGRLTYLAVCTGCHTYSSVLHGPSMQSIQALYGKDEAALVKYIANPVRKRSDFAEMPPQAYLGDETLKAISHFILNELSQ